MRWAVISDIHGNMEAFQQVLIDIEKSDIDTIISLGDNIGYGPEPEKVVGLIRARNIPTVMGNHEWGVSNRKHLKWFNETTRKSLIKTIQVLSDESIDFICDLNTSMVFHDCRFVHGFPPDSVTLYLFQASARTLKRAFLRMRETHCFVGHTHELEIVSFDGQTVTREPLTRGTRHLHREKRYMVNVGSVGQPRDGNNNAKYIIWDTSTDCIEVRFVPYDIARVAEKILKADLPEQHAARLW
jgi:predicted phosphodiesterase